MNKGVNDMHSANTANLFKHFPTLDRNFEIDVNNDNWMIRRIYTYLYA